jgi:phosphocarrier protein HPr
MTDPMGSDDFAEGQFEIRNERGLHARAASKLVQLAGRFPCEVLLSSPECEDVNGKSVMGVLLLCGARGTLLRVRARGARAKECVDALGALVDARFGEER